MTDAPLATDGAEPALFAYIRENELGGHLMSQTPYGSRPMVYADYTASGRAVAFLEDYVREALLPTYGNTHTSITRTGRQSSDFVAEARTIIKNYLRCSKHDRLLFAGAGATACANRLVAMLGLGAPSAAARAAARRMSERPLVLVGPYEHHSNLLPWRESVADVVVISEDEREGGADLAELEAVLVGAAAEGRPLVVGAFSAASNVTGIIARVDDITALLHRHGALAVWDYASAAPYGVELAMNPPHADAERAALIAKDALFFSPHKFVGGPQASGVLVYKKALATRGVSSAPGGGTVFYVSRDEHVYLKNDEEREEGGTPSIIGAIRAGLAMQLQRAVTADAIATADAAILRDFRAAFDGHPNLAILGHATARRLPIFALVVRAPAVGGGDRAARRAAAPCSSTTTTSSPCSTTSLASRRAAAACARAPTPSRSSASTATRPRRSRRSSSRRRTTSCSAPATSASRCPTLPTRRRFATSSTRCASSRARGGS